MFLLATILSLILPVSQSDAGGASPGQWYELALADIVPPRFERIDSCGGWSVSYSVSDNTPDDGGLSSITLVSDQPGTIELRFAEGLNQSDPTAEVTAVLADGIPSAGGWLVAGDVNGNVDSMRVELLRRTPSFSDTIISFLNVGRNEKRRFTLRIVNSGGGGSITVQRARLQDGRYFSVRNVQPGGWLDIPVVSGDSLLLEVDFQQGLSRSYNDTLVVTLDCVEYRIPIVATVGRPLLAVENLDFWQVIIGTEECVDLTVMNPGTDTVYISAIEVGGGEYRFDTAAIPFLPDRIAPGDTITVPICFLPRRLGLLLGTVTFISSAADTVSVVARLVGIGVNSFNSAGFDNEGRELQVTVVPQQRFLTVVSEDRSRDLETFRLYNMRGEEIRIEGVDLIGKGWWQIRLASSLNVGMYFLSGHTPGSFALSVKFVVLE